MWKKNPLSNARRRCCRFRGKYAKNPSLATIPENKTFVQSSHISSSYNRPNIYGWVRICILILFPVYIMTTSLLIGAIHRYDGQQSVDNRQTFESSVKSSSYQVDEAIKERKKRVVYLSSNNNFNTDDFSTSMVERIATTKHGDHQSRDYDESSPNHKTSRSQHDDRSQDGEYDQRCKPMAKWQSLSFPTCNSLHEMNVFSTSSRIALRKPAAASNFRVGSMNANQNIIQDTYDINHLGNGWFRDAWKVHDQVTNSSIAIKTLRLERDFMPEYFELHRRDSVSLERLTESPYIMDIYGFCGQSAVTELAFLNNGLNDLYRLATGMMNNFSPYILRTKLQIAAMTARAVAHVHSVPPDDEFVANLDKHSKTPASIVHYDINPRNVIITPSGRPKLNDFNVAEFLSWDTFSNSSCGFQGRFREPWWRSPEEMQSVNADNIHPKQLDEKVDVYSLGNTLFVLLTGTEPLGKKQKKKRLRQVSQELANGMSPEFPTKYKESNDPAVVAIRKAIMLCWETNPSLRPSAEEIASQLYTALGDLAMGAS